MRVFSIILACVLCIFSFTDTQAQQDPHYTQYMFNTMSVNPAYVGSKGHAMLLGLARTQWVGFDGAPNTQMISYDAPFGYNGIGLGFNLVNDELGPSHEVYLDGNVSYTINVSEGAKLAFGLKLGSRLLNIDWTLGVAEDKTDEAFINNIENKFMPTIGAGLYYYTSNWYAGFSVPNFLKTQHYDELNKKNYETAVERMHFFLIAGYVFELSDNLKFKPAALTKVVPGAPFSLDLSANFLFNNKFRGGIAWRWDDSIAALLGFQATDKLHIGYSYDLTTSNFHVANSGTHELFLRLEMIRNTREKSPRFF